MLVTIDVETFPFRAGDRLPKVVCASIATPAGDLRILRGEDIPRWLLGAMADGHTIVGHNVAFDLGCIAHTWPWMFAPIFSAYDHDRVRCTMLWAKLADIAVGLDAKRYDLGSVCGRKGIPCADKESPWRTRFGELEPLATSDWPEEAIRYSLLDAQSTLALAERLPAHLPDVTAQARWHYWLTLSSALGLETDPEAVAQWEASKRELEAGLMVKCAGFFDAGKAKQAAIRAQVEKAYAAEGKPVPLTPKGRTSIASSTLRDTADPLLLAWATLAETRAALQRELPILREPVVHTRYGLAATGRSISEKPNLQNLNRTSGSRSCFRPRAGRAYAILDYGKLELCALGQLCNLLGAGDGLAAEIRAGIDPHATMGAEILGVSMAEFAAHDERKHYRQAAKAANFGLPGGLGVDGFRSYAWQLYGVRLTKAEAARIVRAWKRKRPDCVRYMDRVGKLVAAQCSGCHRTDTGPFAECHHCGSAVVRGRVDHYRSGRLRGGLTYTQGCNTLFQGLGGDVTKAAGWELLRGGWLPSVFVHDEYVVEVPIQGAAEAAHEVARILNAVAADWLPYAPSTAEPTLAMRWTKADPWIVDGELRLIPA